MTKTTQPTQLTQTNKPIQPIQPIQPIEVPHICLICSVLARLAYFTENKFIDKYEKIFHESESFDKKTLRNIASTDIKNIFNYSESDKNISVSARQINKINYTNASASSNNANNHATNKHASYVSISTSNYSSAYVVADKIMNTVFVIFRGTYSAKSSLSYLKQSSFFPKNVCDAEDSSSEGYLLGIFKITQEIIHTIMESILYLAQQFLKGKSIKIVTTGHSLGASMSKIFSYLWIKMRNSANSANVYNRTPYNILSNRIACVTFGSPRIMNKTAIEKYNKLINEKYIMFQRIITKGDPFPHTPFSSKAFERSFYHPDDSDPKMLKHTITCNNVLRNQSKKSTNTKKRASAAKLNRTKKSTNTKSNRKNSTNVDYNAPLNCENVHDKSIVNLSSHGIYLYISYAGAANELSNMKKEIMRVKNGKYEFYKGDTVCRIFISASGVGKVVFFVLNDAKDEEAINTTTDGSFIDKMKHTIKHKFATITLHQDVLITQVMFNKIVNNSIIIDPKEEIPLFPSNSQTLIHIDDESANSVNSVNPKHNINCLTL